MVAGYLAFLCVEKAQNTSGVRHGSRVAHPKVYERWLPLAFVFKKGKVSGTMKELVQDFRKCMYPNTAMKLEDASRLKMKDYAKSARQFGVSHMVAYHRYKSSTEPYYSRELCEVHRSERPTNHVSHSELLPSEGYSQ